MNMGDMTRYDMIRLADNSNPSAQLLMDFEQTATTENEG